MAFSKEVIDILCIQPVNGTLCACFGVSVRESSRWKIHRHGGWRKKLFDSELSMPLAASGLSSGVITVAWLDDGRMMARSDFRKGVMGCTT